MPSIDLVAALRRATRRRAFSEDTAGRTVMACLRASQAMSDFAGLTPFCDAAALSVASTWNGNCVRLWRRPVP